MTRVTYINASVPTEVDLAEYRMLRDDERYYLPYLATLISVFVLVAGTSVFFLLGTCALTHKCTHDYPRWTFALVPAPTLALLALIVETGLIASVRSDLLRGLEYRLTTRYPAFIPMNINRAGPDVTYQRVPVFWLNHIIRPIVNLPLSVVTYTPIVITMAGGVGSITFLSGRALNSEWGEIACWAAYGAIESVIAAAALTTLWDGAFERSIVGRVVRRRDLRPPAPVKAHASQTERKPRFPDLI